MEKCKTCGLSINSYSSHQCNRSTDNDILDTAIDLGISLAITSLLSSDDSPSSNSDYGSSDSGSSFDSFGGGDFGGGGSSDSW
jgi:uncharacterized membrane protein YgcG